MQRIRSRKGVASVVGTVIFVLVLMIALGAQAYVSGLQAETTRAGQQAQQNSNQRSDEMLMYVVAGSGLTVTDSSTSESKIVGMLLKFANGTVYDLNPGSTPAFAPVYLPANANAAVQSMVPSGSCGSSSCLRKYQSVVGSIASGNAIGLVTTMGNVFWYPSSLVNWSQLTAFPPACVAGQYATTVGTSLTCSQVGYGQLVGFPSACPSGQFIVKLDLTPVCAQAGTAITSRVSADQTLSYSPIGPFGYVSTTLAIPISANTDYDFIMYGEVTGISGATSTNFEVHSLPSGATVQIVCGFVVSSTTGCQTAATTPILSTLPQNTNPAIVMIWGTIIVGPTNGTLQLDFLIPSATSVTLKAGSYMWAQWTA